jgi:hypothetical protein
MVVTRTTNHTTFFKEKVFRSFYNSPINVYLGPIDPIFLLKTIVIYISSKFSFIDVVSSVGLSNVKIFKNPRRIHMF